MMEDRVTYKFTRTMKPILAKMSIGYQAWNGGSLCVDIEVLPSATPEQVFAELQKRSEEKLDDPSLFHIMTRKDRQEPRGETCAMELFRKRRWTDESMYTPDMMRRNWKPDLGLAGLTTEQANALRPVGSAGDHATVSGIG
jgi:hypothetical protein